MKLWLNVIEGAEYASVCRDTIYTACEQHELQHVHLAGRRAIRLKPSWIDAWLERHVVHPAPVKAGAGSKVTS